MTDSMFHNMKTVTYYNCFKYKIFSMMGGDYDGCIKTKTTVQTKLKSCSNDIACLPHQRCQQDKVGGGFFCSSASRLSTATLYFTVLFLIFAVIEFL